MSKTKVNIILRAYDQFAPLIIGAVDTPKIDVSVHFNTPLSNDFPDGIQAAEVSFNRYVMAYAKGDHRLVGIPAFVLRGFRHRNYIVRRDSTLTSLSELKGKRIGTNSWSDTGTMWARAALREAGVGVEDVRWVIGPLDETVRLKPKTPFDVEPPSGSELLSGEENLMACLSDGSLDVVTTAFMPASVYQVGGPFRRLVEDFRSAEIGYHERTGIYPAFHVMAFERSFAEQNPEAVLALYDALRASWEIWWTKVKNFGEASPWSIEEAETMLRDFPLDVAPFGLESSAHRKMLEVMCHEQFAQKIVPNPADPKALFRDFEALLNQR